jgi:hypothetical protein
LRRNKLFVPKKCKIYFVPIDILLGKNKLFVPKKFEILGLIETIIIFVENAN